MNFFFFIKVDNNHSTPFTPIADMTVKKKSVGQSVTNYFAKTEGGWAGLVYFPLGWFESDFAGQKKGEITQLGSPHNCGCYSSLIESKDMTATHHFQKHFCAISCVSRHHAEMRRRYHSSSHDAQIAIPIITTLQAMEAGVLQIAAAISDHLITGVSTQLLWWAINQLKPLASN